MQLAKMLMVPSWDPGARHWLQRPRAGLYPGPQDPEVLPHCCAKAKRKSSKFLVVRESYRDPGTEKQDIEAGKSLLIIATNSSCHLFILDLPCA